MIRARPKGMAGQGKWSTYWPPGDVLNFWPTLLRVALERMQPQCRPPYLRTLLAVDGETWKELEGLLPLSR